MSFGAPLWLGLMLPLLALGAWLGWHLRREFRRRLRAFSAAALPLSALRRRQLRLAVLVVALLALACALARPLGDVVPLAAQREGVNLVIALDASRSMLAEDVAPNRFTRAQSAIDRLLGELQGDRAGLMIFGGAPTLVSPLTYDTVSLQLVNRGVSVELAGKGGSSPAEAIKRAAKLLGQKNYRTKIVLLVTDGEETDGDAVVAAQKVFREDGVRVFTFGVGRETGAAIPVLQRDARRELVRDGTLRDAQGAEVRTRLDAQLLQAVAAAAGGEYVDVSAGDDGVAGFYRRALRPLATPMDDVPLRDRVEWFQLPLVLALALLVWEWRARALAPTVLAAFGALLMFAPSPARAAEGAQALLAAGRGTEAFGLLQKEFLAHPDDPFARYNYAVGAYAAGRFQVAAEAFAQVAALAPDPALAARCAAQLGNSQYRQGEAMRATNAEGAIVWWERALASYAQAPDESQARTNHAKTRADLLALRLALAAQREREGDVAARLTPDKGVPAWRAASEQLAAALKLASDSESAEVAAARATVDGKIFRAFFASAEEKRRRAERQKANALERAIESLNEAVSDYGDALSTKPGDAAAVAAKAKAEATLAPWLVELAEQQRAQGERARSVALEEALGWWQKAAANYAKALAKDPSNAAARAGEARNRELLYAGWLALGEEKESRAGAPGLSPAESDELRFAALGHYQSALALAPGDAAATEKIARLGARLVDVFFARGHHELEEGRGLATKHPPEAIAWLERAAQSLGQALRFEPAHAEAQRDRVAVEELLKRLRDADAESQRKVLAHNKDLTDPKPIEDPGRLALKLLEYDTDKLAAKKPQDFTSPENKPTKDW